MQRMKKNFTVEKFVKPSFTHKIMQVFLYLLKNLRFYFEMCLDLKLFKNLEHSNNWLRKNYASTYLKYFDKINKSVKQSLLRLLQCVIYA